MFNKIIQNLKLKIQYLLSHSGFRKYFFNTGWLMLDKVLRMFLGLFVGAWVARYLGPSDYGILSFSMSFVGLFGAFSKLGLDGIIVRNIVREPHERDEILGTSFVLKLSGAIVLLLTVFGALQLTSTNDYEKVIVMIIAFGQLFMSFEVIDIYFQSQVQAKFSGITGTFGLLVASVTRIIFILLGLPLIWFAAIVLIEQLTRAAFFLYFYTKTTKPQCTNKQFFLWNFNKKSAIKLLMASWPLILSGIVIAIYLKIDQIIIKELMGNEAVGQYAAAVRLSEIWYFIPIVICTSLFPAILNAKKQNEELYYARFQKLYDLMFWLAFIIALPTTFLSNWIVELLYGSEYSQAGVVLMIHIWTGLFVFLGSPTSKWFVSENLQIYSLYRSIIGVIINILVT
jgi:O-antigen/teichoic acid export membrane protein